MEIKNKEFLKAQLKAKVALNIKQFPFYFYFNIFINIVVAVLIVATMFFIGFVPPILIQGMMVIVFLLVIFHITVRDLFKNIRILNTIRAGHYDLDIEDYELDNTLEFIEQLPMSKEEAERMKEELSFSKLINLLDLFGIICCKDGMYDLDLIVRNEMEEAIGEEN
jgi:ABC-type multidrug transport system fused ATPase/permease subunit